MGIDENEMTQINIKLSVGRKRKLQNMANEFTDGKINKLIKLFADGELTDVQVNKLKEINLKNCIGIVKHKHKKSSKA